MNNEGVSILQIVVTIIIMILILSIAIFSGQNIVSEARIASVYNEIKEIKSIIEELYILNDIKENEDSILIYDSYSAPKINKEDYNKELKDADSNINYYLLDFTSSKDLENVLELEQIDNNYILDLENKKLYLIGGIDISVEEDGKKVTVLEYDSDEIEKYYNKIFAK